MDQPIASDVEAAAAGDVDAFSRVVRGMQDRVWRYVVVIVRDHALAEDITQEVFIRVFKSLHTIDDLDRFIPWLLAIARNAAYDSGRAKKRRPLVLVGDRDLPEPAPPHDPNLSAEVHDALDQLGDKLRDALVLVTVIGLSYQEAADTLGVPEGTVKSRVFRARIQMAEMLGIGADDAR